MKNYYYFFLSIFLSSCCEGPIYYQTTKIISVKTELDSSVSINEDFEFNLSLSDSIMSIRLDDKGNCADGINIEEPIHFVNDIKIITVNDFSPSIVAGSDISDLVRVNHINLDNEEVDSSLEEWLAFTKDDADNTFRFRRFQNYSNFYYISQRAFENSPQKISIIIELSDGTSISVESAEIIWE